MKTSVKSLDIKSISVRDRLRPVDGNWAEAIAASIESVGLLHPIVVAETDEGFVLIDGAHRLDASGRVLGHKTITASVVGADTISGAGDLRLREIIANIARIPVDGAVAMVFAIGGDQGDLRAVPIANPAKRMGKLAEGEIGMYNEHGDKAVLTAGGNLDINTGAQVNIKTAKSASITAEESVSITADTCNVDGNIKCTGEVEDHTGTMQKMRDQYNGHGHPDASAPPGPLQD